MDLKLIKTQKGKIIFRVIFLIYLALLVKVILLKYPGPMIMTILKSGATSPLRFRISNSNFVPLKTIANFLFRSQNFRISLENILGNIIAFVPLGFLLPIVFNRENKLKFVLISSLILSLVFEVIQLLTAIGELDVDDILLNIIGSICGYIFYKALIYLKLIKENY